MSDVESDNEVRLKEPKKGKLIKEAEEYKQALEKRGVIYISRVPPFMKPNKVRNMFEQYGEVTRLYLAEEGEFTALFIPLKSPLINFNAFRHSSTPEAKRKRRQWLKTV